MFGPDSLHGPLVDGFLRSFFQGTLGYVGFEVIAPFVAYHVPYLALEQRQALLDKLETHIAMSEHTPKIAIPDLANFSDRFESL